MKSTLKKSGSLSRRQFLTAVGMGGAAAAAVAVSSREAGSRGEKPASNRQGKGYQLTEHVRRYYETTKV